LIWIIQNHVVSIDRAWLNCAYHLSIFRPLENLFLLFVFGYLLVVFRYLATLPLLPFISIFIPTQQHAFLICVVLTVPITLFVQDLEHVSQALVLLIIHF